MLEELVTRIDTQERRRRLALEQGDPERAWAAQHRRSVGYFAPSIDLGGLRRAATTVVALLLRSS